MLHKDNCKPIREAFEFLGLVCLILEILRYLAFKLWDVCCEDSVENSLWYNSTAQYEITNLDHSWFR